MALRIDLDHRRFREIVRGKIKQNLRKYISQGEMIGQKGKDMVSIPLPQIDIPHFRFGNKEQGGVGQGEGDVGDSLGKGEPNAGGAGKAGDQAGRAPARGRAVAGGAGRRSWARSCSCRASSPRASERIVAQKDKYVGIRTTGPESLRHFRAPSGRRCAGRSRRAPTTRRTRSSSRCARTSATARGARAAAAVERGHHLHDGRLGLDGRRAEGDRPHRVLLDRHLAALAVPGHRERATSSTTRWPRRSTATRSSARASRAAR